MRLVYRSVMTAICALALTGCPQSANGPINCPGGEQRVKLDCSSEVEYQGTKGSGSVNVMDIAGASGSFEQTALRRVSEHIQQFASMHTRLCREYNSCVVDQAEYRAKADDIQKRLTLVPVLTEAVKNAKSETERLKALDKLYQAIVPDEDRVEEITFAFGLTAMFPPELGGGKFMLAPGGTVTTNTRIWLTVNVSKQAHLYMFQTKPSGEITVLFPNPDIRTENPLPAGVPRRIPPIDSQFFRVNEEDIGIEKVFFVVSQEPVQDLDAALAKVNSGEVTTVTQDQLLQSVSAVGLSDEPSTCKSRGLELVSESGCVRSRGLELAGEPSAPSSGGGAPPPSMEVRTAPGDGLIAKVFHFEHLTVADFKKRGGTKAVRHRGLIMED